MWNYCCVYGYRKSGNTYSSRRGTSDCNTSSECCRESRVARTCSSSDCYVVLLTNRAAQRHVYLSNSYSGKRVFCREIWHMRNRHRYHTTLACMHTLAAEGGPTLHHRHCRFTSLVYVRYSSSITSRKHLSKVFYKCSDRVDTRLV